MIREACASALLVVACATPDVTVQTRPCTSTTLAGTLTQIDPGAGQRVATLRVRNTGTRPCTLTGYGPLRLHGPTGHTPTAVHRTLPPGPARVLLPPGGAADRTLQWTVVAGVGEPATGPCQPESTAIDVTPPADTGHLTVSHPFGPVCGHGHLDTNAWHP